jgi:hypothetical protein
MLMVMRTTQRQKRNLIVAPAPLREALCKSVATDGEMQVVERLQVDRLTLARCAAGFLVCRATAIMLGHALGIDVATGAPSEQLPLPLGA